jgi:hypothetical protein
MSPDDPRHGTYAGRQAHWRDDEDPCDPCVVARLRTRKKWELEKLAGVRSTYTRAELDQVLEPWLALGLGPAAVSVAAGMGNQRGSCWVQNDGPVRRRTYMAVAALTEADFHPSAKLWADLTRQRVWSLMAAGHPLTSLPINPSGQWRTRDKVTVGQAVTIRAFYDEHQAHPGPSVYTRSRALMAGYLPPAAWDDPGTLAWPLGWTQPIPAVVEPIDEVKVQRILAGDNSVHATKAERVEVVAAWRAAGRPLRQLEILTGWKTERYYDPTQEVA